MFQRFDKLQIDLPMPDKADPAAAAAVQELMGGRFGEMSTLMNYMNQSFNFRQKKKLKPFYDLIASITGEELGHVELVSATINSLMEGATSSSDDPKAPLAPGLDAPNLHHFIVNAQTSMPGNSMGQPWQGDYVFNSGNLVLDLLHNFFLECGARTHKMRVYQMTSHPVAREMIGYLLVRGGVHTLAYAKALEEITGVDVKKMMPIPDLDNSKYEEAEKFERLGLHRKLFTFSPEDYRDIDKIWVGNHPDDGKPLEVEIGMPEGGEKPDFEAKPEEFAPGYSPEDFYDIAAKLQKRM
ncbi:manganese catalase family protein [Alkalicoccus halolimnae]|uniref:Manganese catalase family protein n=1 Tax=Alkalicoccus halolimnae TaxID=1667239 RepID=A0A5C7FNR8_9BACI|nr:manganese catalase family protein [Alkalicoccus halolimnae]TXF86976.1 manganese catalase family protein [Alkalicoccus halolimnae]